ncbi:ATP-dependent Clp protease ATP-binding subunit [Fibrivirga algicola]|uniref:ATP-dependent Clp protease ATP-binding subunit n=1 Tax=Fibrivirga algicola TaxID=2950420 RepID=A0ABX0QHR2_9BACT|nr:ATP-dependent Clp protease ATP-binding subunit [Fibrivirga algicola]NID10218.1 ATP-dependent Clp protease ATP-binding subunit [Fibrivirga algicola]
MITLSYTEELRRAVAIAQAIAREHQHLTFSPGHLLQGLLHNDVGLASQLAVWEVDVPYLRDWADIRVESYPKSARSTEEPTGDKQVRALMEVSDVVRMKLGESELTPVAVLTAMCKPDVAFNRDQLKSFPLTEQQLLEKALMDTGFQQAINGQTGGSATNGKSLNGQAASDGAGAAATGKTLYKFCTDRTASAREGKLDPIVGRERETRQMIEILGRRLKPNVIITGEPGVGKTALVEGLAQQIVAGYVPPHLKNAQLFQLDMGSLIAGASYKGEIEDRMKGILTDLKQVDRALLFIDEIHMLLDPQGGATGLVNLLKPELARGELTLIGATTNDEYRKYLEKDEAFARRFEVLAVEEPDELTATWMVQTLLPLFEKHHQIGVGDTTVAETVRLAKRYLKGRRLPDAAIDLIDRTMAAMKMAAETTQPEIERLRLLLAALREKATDADSLTLMPDVRRFERQVKNCLSPVLLGQLETDLETDAFDLPEALIDHLDMVLTKLEVLGQQVRDKVEPAEVAAVVANRTGIPLGKIQSKERDKLLALDEHLKQRVVGQNHAVNIIADAILENRSGLSRPGQPIGSFFFSGPTGTGKTELAKAMADFLFNDERALIRFDMSEFKEEHSAALLYGAPPGYVGYEEGGLLVTKIRQQPFSVVLFDEIEKAHPSVFDIFLQILDEGLLHDRLGREGDFSNAIILFTSNIGSDFVVEKAAKGEIAASNELLEIMGRFFRPEFLGRLTEIVPFQPISEGAIVQIFNIQLASLLKTLDKQGITVMIDDEARRKLALEGYTPKYGARPLRGVIRNRLRRPLSRLIVSGEIGKGSVLTLLIGDDGELRFDTVAARD